MKTIISKCVEIDYGHRVPNHKSRCAYGHGHRGRIVAFIEGPVIDTKGASDEGMVQDFGDLKVAMMKSIHDALDHRFVMYVNDPLWAMLFNAATPKPEPWVATSFGQVFWVNNFGYVQLIPCVPTAENLASLCFDALCKQLEADKSTIKVVALEFWETPTSMARVEIVNEKFSKRLLSQSSKDFGAVPLR